MTEQAKLPGNHMTVRSMDGILIKLEDGSFDAGRAPRYPGTTIALTLKL